MAQNVVIAGALFSDVPSISVPDQNNVFHSFTDVSDTTAAAADVASGKYFYTAAGVYTEGTASGGGGSSNWTLLKTQSIGSVTATTTATSMDINVEVPGIDDYDLLVFAATVDTIPTLSRHIGTFMPIILSGSNTIDTKNSVMLGSALNVKKASDAITSRSSTTSYGIYPYSSSVSNGTVTFSLYKRSNSTQTGTINGSYSVRVYGVKLYDLIGN